MKPKQIIIVILFAIVGVGLLDFFLINKLTGRNSILGSAGAGACNGYLTTTVSVGKDLSTQIVASSSNRAWARISQPINATNTTSLAFNEDEPSVVGRGIELSAATTSSLATFIDFGLNTQFPYINAVQGISNVGSTTVLVTECKY